MRRSRPEGIGLLWHEHEHIVLGFKPRLSIMPGVIIILISLTVFLPYLIKKSLHKGLVDKQNNYEQKKAEYEELAQENIRLKQVNSKLEHSSDETIALYYITKDICKTLDEDKIFNLFKGHLNKYIELRDCMYLKNGADILQYPGYTVFPLALHKTNIGYLVADGINEQDKDKFHILAHQFMLGIKRALLYQKVQELTITDTLTQIFNRRYFLEKFYEEFRRSKKFKYSFSFLMIDVDNFKSANDNYGHLVGDAILKGVTRTIKENIRQIDFMGRYGGEELSVILPETDKERACFASERIRQAIESRDFRVYDENLKITISIGISTFPVDACQTQGVIEKADQALYLAKQTGRNKVCAYGKDMY